MYTVACLLMHSFFLGARRRGSRAKGRRPTESAGNVMESSSRDLCHRASQLGTEETKRPPFDMTRHHQETLVGSLSNEEKKPDTCFRRDPAGSIFRLMTFARRNSRRWRFHSPRRG